MTAHQKPVGRRVLDLKDPVVAGRQGLCRGRMDRGAGRQDDRGDRSLRRRAHLEVPDLGAEAARRAIDAAHAVQKEWARRTAKERSHDPEARGTT